MKFRLAIAVALLAFVAVFSVQNSEVVEVRLLFWTITMSRALLLFFVFGLGAATSWLIGTFRHARKS